MSELVRFGVSLEQELLHAFDRFIERKAYPNRSEAIRDLIRQELVEQSWADNKIIVGTVTLVYDHHHRELLAKLTDAQHHFGRSIISSMHVHLDSHYCLEVIVVKGASANVKKLANQLIGTKGVIHGKLTMATTGKGLG